MNSTLIKIIVIFFSFFYFTSDSFAKEYQKINSLKKFSGVTLTPNLVEKNENITKGNFLVSLFYRDRNKLDHENTVIATSVTDNNGNFVLDLGNNFEPKKNDIFVLEAIKKSYLLNKELFRLKSYIVWNGDYWENYYKKDIKIDTKTSAIYMLSYINEKDINITVPEKIKPFSIRSEKNYSLKVNDTSPLSLIEELEKLILEGLENNRNPFVSILYSDSKYSSSGFYIDISNNLKLLTDYKKCTYCDFKDLDLFNIDFENVNISNSRIYNQKLKNKSFKNSLMENIDLKEVIFDNCDFEKANFKNSQIHLLEINNSNLKSSIFDNSKMYQGSFKNNDFSLSSFKNIDFTRVQNTNSLFLGSDMSNAKFSDFDLQNTSFENCILENTYFSQSNLEGSNLNLAKIKNKVSIYNSKLKKTNISNINFENFSITTDKSYVLDFINAENSVFNAFSLANVILENSNFKNISFKYSGTLSNFSIYSNSKLKKVDFSNSNFNNINISSSEIIDTNFSNSAFLSTVSFFSNSKITNLDLSNTKFLELYMVKSEIKDSIFKNLNVKKNRFSIVLENTNFDNSDFENFNFNAATFDNVSFTNCNLKNLDFEKTQKSNKTTKKDNTLIINAK
ncbi:MAG: pentapeptide repeat-containing protein [Cyanobacteriota bacterium]